MKLAKPPETSEQIQALMRKAREEGLIDEALTELARLEAEAPSLLREEAAFRRVQLLLRYQYPDALNVAKDILSRLPHHALVPYLYLWLSEWWAEQQDDAQVLIHTAAALAHVRLTREVAEEVLSLGASTARRSPDWEAVQWFFTAARVDVERRDTWLREAAARASISMIARLRETGVLTKSLRAGFYLHAARTRLMTGNISEVQTIAAYLAEDEPGSRILATLRAWAAGETEPAMIGALLPLSGPYARYGAQALQGIRLALASLEGGEQITLRIEDTGSDASACILAYQRLIEENIDMIIGPLLARCAESLAPYLVAHLPVMTLTSRSDIAAQEPQMFVHTLSLSMQARFMAEYAWNQGERRIVLVVAATPSSQIEAAAFQEAFQALGGEIIDTVVLFEEDTDARDAFRKMRSRTDDEELLAELDEELALSVHPNLEIRMPVNFDAMYLSLPGKMVALLAGQLAYVDIVDINLYGSGRWQDGHLLDDRGRYLRRARFSDVTFPLGSAPNLRRLLFDYRAVWGGQTPGKLVGLAYDSALIAAMITSRLGFRAKNAVSGLKDRAGFPGLTGHVRFDAQGIGHKAFEVFMIRRARIVPAS